MLARVDIHEARDLDFQDLVERTNQILAAFDVPEVEAGPQKMQRLSQTLDMMPAHYRWFLQLHAFCDHWAAGYAKAFTQKSDQYQRMRQRRDHFEDMASAAKMRYEAASRQITLEQGFDPTGMPRSR